MQSLNYKKPQLTNRRIPFKAISTRLSDRTEQTKSGNLVVLYKQQASRVNALALDTDALGKVKMIQGKRYIIATNLAPCLFLATGIFLPYSPVPLGWVSASNLPNLRHKTIYLRQTTINGYDICIIAPFLEISMISVFKIEFFRKSKKRWRAPLLAVAILCTPPYKYAIALNG